MPECGDSEGRRDVARPPPDPAAAGRGRPGAAGRRIGAACALALALLACAPPAAAELCDGSLHADNTKYEPVAIYHELSEGTFRGFCANQEYGVFDIFLDAEPGEGLELIVPKAEFNPRQFDYPSCSFGYGANGEGTEHPGIRAEQVGQTDRTRTIRFSWDVYVSQISYLESPAACVEKQAVVDHLTSTPTAFPRWSGSNLHLVAYDASCAGPYDHIVRLDHAIYGGRLDKICSIDEGEMVFYISPESAGELVVDIPKDVFPPYDGGFDPPGYREPWNMHDAYPFTITTWSRSGIPSSVSEFHHTEDVSRPSRCAKAFGCMPVPFWWGGQISKISSHDAFDRYSIPFGADDVKIELWMHLPMIRAQYHDYHPERDAAGPREHFCR